MKKVSAAIEMTVRPAVPVPKNDEIVLLRYVFLSSD